MQHENSPGFICASPNTYLLSSPGAAPQPHCHHLQLLQLPRGSPTPSLACVSAGRLLSTSLTVFKLFTASMG